MSRKRHEPCVRCLGLTLAPGYAVAPHEHEWPQLVYAARGVIVVTTDAGNWVIPPMRALWVQAGVRHSLQMRGRVEVQTLYFRPDVAPEMKPECCVISVSPLLRELIVAVNAAGFLDDSSPSGRARLRVLLDLLDAVPQSPLSLPLPIDPRARRVTDRVFAALNSQSTLEMLARSSGASERTIERVFLRQTGMTFGQWRQQARLLEAIRQLGEGAPVTSVAIRVGYRSPSAFVAAFRRCFGRTPARFYKNA